MNATKMKIKNGWKFLFIDDAALNVNFF